MFQKQPDSLRLAAHRAPVTPEPPRYRPSTQHRPAASCPLCRAQSGPLPTTASFSQHHPGPATPNIRATPAAVPFLSESPSDRNSNRGASGWHPDPWGQRSWRRHQTRSDRSGLHPPVRARFQQLPDTQNVAEIGRDMERGQPIRVSFVQRGALLQNLPHPVYFARERRFVQFSCPRKRKRGEQRQNRAHEHMG